MKKAKPKKSPMQITPVKKIVFTIIMMFIPVISLIILELALRYFNYGPNLSIFAQKEINGNSYYVMNPSVTQRYFDQSNFNPSTSSDYFLVNKPKGAIRIFCLGGSTTVGYPYWYNGSFSSFLRDRLNAIFPDKQIEVINLGLTATNSFTVLDICKGIVDFKPDLIIVYDGHNEFYGALGIASNESGTSFRWLTLLHLKLIHYKTYQLVKEIISWTINLFDDDNPTAIKSSTLMEHVAKGKNIPLNSADYWRANDWFKVNMEETIELCNKNNVPIIFSTQVSNLKNQSPFISKCLSVPNKKGILDCLAKADVFTKRGLVDSSITFLKKAIKINFYYAQTHYQLAQNYLTKGMPKEAYTEFVRARDCDELRFRTDTNFNQLILSMQNKPGCYVADIEKIFSLGSPNNIVGNELILEHLHPNSKGQFLIAKEFARIMQQNNLIVNSSERSLNPINEDLLWENRNITEIDELLANHRVSYLTSGWPFTNQSPSELTIDEKDTLKSISLKAMHNQISWINMHLRAAQFYSNRKNLVGVERELKTIINQFPLEASNYLNLARLYYDGNKFSDAEKIILKSLKVETTPIAFRALGDTYMKQQNYLKAIQAYEAINKLSPDPQTFVEVNYFLSLAYLITNQNKKAIDLLHNILNNFPTYQPAKQLLLSVEKQFGKK